MKVTTYEFTCENCAGTETTRADLTHPPGWCVVFPIGAPAQHFCSACGEGERLFEKVVELTKAAQDHIDQYRRSR